MVAQAGQRRGDRAQGRSGQRDSLTQPPPTARPGARDDLSTLDQSSAACRSLTLGLQTDGLADRDADERGGSMERLISLSCVLELAGQLRDSARCQPR